MLRIIVAAIAGLVTTTPVIAGNFEFVVPGEPGLSLTITGYDKTDGQIFEATANRPEQRDGKPFYIVRIDETILNIAPMARWCVEDASGKWSELEGREGATGLCDDKPSETRGSYGFKPLSVMTATVPAVDQAAVPKMSVADAAACVQESLNRIGFDAGPVDGQMGRRTFEAALGFASVQDDQVYPDLSEDTAAQWCATMTAAIDAGAARGPMEEVARFRFGPDVDVSVARDTRAGIEAVDAYFKKSFGSALEKPGTIYVSSDAEWMADNYVAHLKVDHGVRSGKVEWFTGCHGGEAGYGFMFMCANSDVFSGDWFGAGRAAQRSFALAHEYFHMLQYERAYGRLEGCCSGNNSLKMLGPQWLVEGSAEYVAFRLLGDSGEMNLKREIDWHTQKAAEVGSTLAEMQTRQGYYAEPRASSAGMIAAHLLAEDAGLQSLADFYAGIGSGKDWEAAFEAAFGMTAEEFSVRYEDHIH
jgi:hypothetical protein